MSSKKKDIKKDKRSSILRLYSVGTVVILVTIIVVVNILFENILGKYLTFDQSTYGQNSITQASKDFIKSLPENTNIRIVGLFDKPEDVSNSPLMYVMPVLDCYEKESGGKIKVEYVNPETYPSIINQLDPSGAYDLTSGKFAISNGERVVVVDPMDCFTYDMEYYQNYGYYKPNSNTVEITFDNAFYSLTSGVSAKAYFVSGLKNGSSVQLKSILTSMGFTSDDVTSAEVFTVPDDCDLLIINGPETDIPEDMVSPIRQYILNGGKILVAVDFTEANQSESFINLNKILSEFNINVDDYLIIENDVNHQLTANGMYSLLDKVTDYASFSSANQLRSSFARPVRSINNPTNYIENKAVLTTSSTATAINADSSYNNATTYNVCMHGYYTSDGTDAKTPAAFVFGTTSFTSDDYISNYGFNDGNVEFVRSCIRTLVGMSADNGITVQSKPIDDFSIDATKATSTNVTVMIIIFMIVIPLGLVATATIVYHRRKNL